MPPSVHGPRSKSIAWFAVVCLLVLAWSAAWFVDEAASTRPAARETPGAATPVSRGAPREVDRPDDVQAPSPEAEGEREVAVAVAEERDPPVASAPARLVVRAEDRSPLGPLRGFNVRVASDRRFAAEHGAASGELELPLTPGTYAIMVDAPGYEPAELASVELASGATVRLDLIVLQPGSACVRGTVFDASALQRRLVIELIGAGRHPCARCIEPSDTASASDVGGARSAANAAERTVSDAWDRRDPCRACGYARDFSRFELHAGDAFAFQNLVHGEYALRLTDELGAPLGDAGRVQLLPGATATIDLDASRSRIVELEFVDVDGRSLTAEWSRRLALLEQEDEIVEYEVVSDFAIDLVAEDDRGAWAKATLVPPALPGTAIATAFSGRKLGTTRDVARRSRTVVDRERTARDHLLREPASPRFAVAVLACEVAPSGLALLGPLPTSELRLRASRANATGAVIVPAASATTRVHLRLQAP